ncbi:hypothetical protein L596_027407 [Steinernema carpocapsae]|uniref:Uncharacterized protein n=1 Tax=Steinernema carpocapsae TaxID=34508 RepID=A0A4U5M490_STECR|nr:hypothetical protein L596_027407 [Steinernema carpocapsae]
MTHLIIFLLGMLVSSSNALLCHKFMYDMKKGFQSNISVEQGSGEDPYCVTVYGGLGRKTFHNRFLNLCSAGNGSGNVSQIVSPFRLFVFGV